MTKTDPLVTDEQINTRTEIEYNVKTGMGVKHDIASAHMHGFRKGLIEMRDSYEKDRAALLRERDALQAFKTYVHQRLDEAGIPTHPPGEHADAGCRVGQRLDLVLAARGSSTNTTEP